MSSRKNIAGTVPRRLIWYEDQRSNEHDGQYPGDREIQRTCMRSAVIGLEFTGDGTRDRLTPGSHQTAGSLPISRNDVSKSESASSAPLKWIAVASSGTAIVLLRVERRASTSLGRLNAFDHRVARARATRAKSGHMCSQESPVFRPCRYSRSRSWPRLRADETG